MLIAKVAEFLRTFYIYKLAHTGRGPRETTGDQEPTEKKQQKQYGRPRGGRPREVTGATGSTGDKEPTVTKPAITIRETTGDHGRPREPRAPRVRAAEIHLLSRRRNIEDPLTQALLRELHPDGEGP